MSKLFDQAIRYAFKAPIITAPGFEDTVTKDQLNQAYTYRLADAKITDKKQATNYEVALYLSYMTQTAPPSHQWYKIYLHVFSKCFGFEKLISHKKGTPEYEEEIKHFEYDSKLEEYDLHELAKIKAWIFKRQVEQLKSKGEWA